MIEKSNYMVKVTRFTMDSMKCFQNCYTIEVNTIVIKTIACNCFNNIAIKSRSFISIIL